MAKTRIPGIMGHQGQWDPSGVDPETRRTLMGGEDPPPPPPPPPPRKDNILEGAMKAIRSITGGVRTKTDTNGNPARPSVTQTRSAPRVRSDAQVEADYQRELAARQRRK